MVLRSNGLERERFAVGIREVLLRRTDEAAAWFRGRLDRFLVDRNLNTIVEDFKAKLLESYRNSQRSRRSPKENEPASEK